MPRSRIIKPDLCHNEYLTTLPFETRLLAGVLPCWADREGRLEDRPRKLKMEIFPADNVDVDAMLDQLVQVDYLQRYEVEGHQYIHIRKFVKHQKPHAHEAKSTLPAPTMSEPRQTMSDVRQTMSAPDQTKSGMGVIEQEQEKEQEQEQEQEQKRAIKLKNFERFWQVYPKKVGKKRCMALWMRSDFDAGALCADIETRLDQDARYQDKRFIPNPETYLNGERWDDEMIPILSDERTKPIEHWFPPDDMVPDLILDYGPDAVRLAMGEKHVSQDQFMQYLKRQSLAQARSQ